MKFFVQLLSFETSPQVLDLLHFPDISFRPPGVALNATLRCSGHRVKGRFKQTGDLIEWIANQTSNEVWITSKSSPEHAKSGQLLSIDQRLAISPRNRLWAPIGETKAETRPGESLRNSAEALERGLRWHKTEAYPTLLETTLEFTGNLEQQEIGEWIALAIPEALAQPTLKGVGEPVGNFGVIANVLQRLAPWNRAVPLLDHLFADIYPVLIGPTAWCNELGSALATLGSVHLAAVKGGAISVLSLSRELLAEPRGRELASPWLVPRDSTTKNLDFDPNKGEFRLGGHPYYTKKRFDELIAERLLPPVLEGYEYRLLVRPEDCRTLGIEESDMLVAFSQVGDQVFEQIDERIKLRPADEPLAQKVIEAYREVYRERGFWLFGQKFEEVLSFLEERYFKLHFS
ncbi:MAG TPA: hypothetical protein VJ885_17195 [Thermoanaerobaculia bacterium]|nr:hypothetical protein [Thermoanaerobaculia bacterium]